MQLSRLLWATALVIAVSGEKFSNDFGVDIVSDPRFREALSRLWSQYPQSLGNGESSENGTISEECSLDMTNAPTIASAKMFDASVKLPSGLMATFTHMGNWDECVSLRDIVRKGGGEPFHGQMCLWKIGLARRETAVDAFAVTDGIDENTILTFLAIKLGACVPSSCSPNDVKLMFEPYVPDLLSDTPYNRFKLQVTVDPDDCTTKDRRPGYDAADWVAVAIYILLAFAVISSTVIDVFIPERRPLVAAFSVFTNGKKLIAVSRGGDGAISCLHDIRFLSMCWVVLGHSYMTHADYPNVNRGAATDFITDFSRIFITNSNLAVDTFFVLSGILLAYIFFRQVPKMKSFNLPMFYIHRYIRLTPAFAFMVLFYATLSVHMGWGPVWLSKTHGARDICREHWWDHLLYLGNYFHRTENCVPQTWFLMVDMQLYWLSPLVLVPLWKAPRLGQFILGALCVAGTLCTFLVSYLMGLPGTMFSPYAMAKKDEYTQFIYKATFARFVPYLIGIALGYTFVQMNNRSVKVKFPSSISLALWVLAICLLLGALFSGYPFLQQPPLPTDLQTAFHNALHRSIWSLGLCLVVFLCSTGHGGFINIFLSWSVFQVLGRFTYSMYLVHMLIMQIEAGSQRTYTFMADVVILPNFAGDLLLSLLFGAALTLVMESPFLVLEKELLSGGSRRRPAATDHGAAAVAGSSPVSGIANAIEKSTGSNV